MNSVGLNNLSLKKRFTPSGCNIVGIRKLFEFVAKNQFLYDKILKPLELSFRQYDERE